METAVIKRVASKPPVVYLNIVFEGPKIARSLAKGALAGACFMYGNEATLKIAAPTLLSATTSNTPDIAKFAGWDYWNEWPSDVEFKPHPSCTDPTLSGFEHILLIGDVADSWVAYITLFGQFHFSMWLGGASGLPPRGLAVNPRSFKNTRFDCVASYPHHYVRQDESSFKDNFPQISRGISTGLNSVLEKWHSESLAARVTQLSSSLVDRLVKAGDSETARQEVIQNWAAELAAIEAGESWTEELDSALLDDGTKVTS